ncbi:hypothetical protein QBC42DRAFT_317632 [Cladorrhinum samala]|uniref:Zn(2)-C6 fungal-type domain-containing protein n=1 Tax=Cladorrhinum samala TaxID=585594 RepID=A0AAV9HXX9_9PEZI|nr:hypothetical protein QBC42DRAFT_317632 [Cladorrhinum samala]
MPRPRVSNRKLRSSCNSCGSAKVRCDRQHPQCRRCASNGLECIYELSRRFGRPPRRRTPVKTIHTREANDSSAIIQHPPELEAVSDAGSSPMELSTTHPEPAPGLDFELLDPQLLEGEWPQLGLMSNPTAALPSSLQHYEPLISPSSSISGSHSCALEPYEIFANLICPAKDIHPPKSNSDRVPVHLDQVLHCNRKAVDRMVELLKCSCSTSTHRLMIHGSILSKILIWYQQAAGLQCSSDCLNPESRGLVELTGMTPSGTFPPSRSDRASNDLAQTTGFIVTAVPASLGTFGIEDHKMQAKIRNHLILSEVEKMSSLVQLFESHISFDSPGSSAAGLHALTTAWIRKEYTDLVTFLKTERSSLDQQEILFSLDM